MIFFPHIHLVFLLFSIHIFGDRNTSILYCEHILRAYFVLDCFQFLVLDCSWGTFYVHFTVAYMLLCGNCSFILALMSRNGRPSMI